MNVASLPLLQANNAALAALVRFCLEQGGACYRGFSPEVLRDYLAFHARHGTLHWLRHHGAVVACGVAWRVNENVIRARAKTGRIIFDWTPDDPAADSIWIADIISRCPGALPWLVDSFARNPHFQQWERHKLFTYRRGWLVQLAPAAVRRLLERKR